MKNKVIYVPISTAIEYPPVGKEAIWINQNGDVYKGKLEEWEGNHSWVNCTTGESLSVFDFQEWIREVMLPSEEEIFKAENEFYKNGMKSKPKVYAFRSGINYILSIINLKK